MKPQFSCASLLLAAIVIQAKSLSDDPYLLVSTDNGPVQGAWNLNLWNKIGKFFGADPTKHSRYFASIPFAEPPVGEGRFRSPRPLTKAWGQVDREGRITGQVKDATSFPAACPQNFFIAFSQSEDCLYLNVFTPPPSRISHQRRLPVMVFIYGGAFNFGDSYTLGSYNARSLTDSQDVIVITLNHRSNAFGFFYTEEEGGNFGLEDQREALRWIKRNIANFGGDPDNVTMFGMSSGATSAILHAVSPATEDGLLHKIIHQSGPLGTVIVSKEEIVKTSLDLAKELNCVTNEKPDLRCLRKIPFKDILKASGPSLNDPRKDPTAGEDFNDDPNQIVDYMGNSYKWWPTLDGENIVGNPVDLIAQGKHKNLPMIIGVQKDEGGLWFLAFDIPIYGSIKKRKLYNPSSYEERLKMLFGRDYNMMSQSYPVQPTAEANVKQFINLITDYAWLCPSEQAALDWSRKNKQTFFYRWTQPTFPPLPRCLDGCCHSNEAPYLFKTIWPLIGSSRQALAAQVQSYWVNFAATGNPNLRADGSKDPNSPFWPAYDSKHVRQELGDRVGPENRTRAEFCAALARMNVSNTAGLLLPTAQVTQAVYTSFLPDEAKREKAFKDQNPGPIRFDPSELESLKELPVF